MTDLVAFLRARLDEDEARIIRLRELVAEDESWRDEDEAGEPAGYNGPDPLREVEAKRRIVKEYEDCLKLVEFSWPNVPDDLRQVGGAFQSVVRLLALPYDRHPDYDPGWKP